MYLRHTLLSLMLDSVLVVLKVEILIKNSCPHSLDEFLKTFIPEASYKTEDSESKLF